MTPLRVLSLLVLCTACAAPPLRVASDLDNMPFAGVDADGTSVGRDVEMMQELADRIGRDLVWVRMPFEQLLEAVETGEVDAVCATLGVTAERQERMAFTRPYYRTSIAVIVRSGEGEPTTLAGLKSLRVSGARGTTAARAVLAHLPHAQAVTNNPKGTPTAERLLRGEIDAAAMDGPAADALVAASGGAIARLAEDLDREDYALAVPLADKRLVRRLNHALDQLSASGWLADLDARHGLPVSAR